MNMNDVEKLILLEQSGELTAAQKKMLDQSPEATAKRAEMDVLLQAVSTLEVEPSPWAATKIDAQLKKERRSFMLPARVWQPILAAAACLTVALNVQNFKPSSAQQGPVASAVSTASVDADVWDTEFDADLGELESLLSGMSSDSLDYMEL